jgi:transcriptional regulator with XRE-family HTH domain
MFTPPDRRALSRALGGKIWVTIQTLLDKIWESAQTSTHPAKQGARWSGGAHERRHGVTDEVSWSPRLGAHLEASRLRAGKRRLDLAHDLGVSEETIRLWEKGSVQPSTDRLAKVIALLSLETTDLSAPAPVERESELPPLARRLRWERQERRMTQAEAVRILDVPQPTYAGWETGRTTPGTYFFVRIAEFLGLAVQEVAALCASPFVVNTSGWPALGKLIGGRRQELRLDRSALAEQLGVAPNTVVAWELGHRVPGPQQLQRLAEGLGIDMYALASAMPHRGPRTTLGDLIIARQRELGLRSIDVAERAGTTEATVSRWVNGRTRPTDQSMRRLAAALEVPYEAVAEAAAA